MAYDANNARQVGRRTQRQKLEDRRAIDERIAVMGTPEGRRFVYRFIASCHVLESAWCPGGPDMARMQDFRLGEQSAGHRMMAEIESAAPEFTALMMDEARMTKAVEAQTQAAEDIDPATEQQEQSDG